MYKPNCFHLSFVLIGLMMGCSEIDDKNYDQAILGVWYQSSPVHGEAARSYRNEYHFRKDGTFKYSLKIIQTEGDKETELGYLALHEGDFQVTENTLLYKQAHYYGLGNENEILPREELVLITAVQMPTTTSVLTKNGIS